MKETVECEGTRSRRKVGEEGNRWSSDGTRGRGEGVGTGQC